MGYAIIWLVVLGLLALWSAAAWAIHAVGTWTASSAGGLAGGAGTLESLRMPDGFAPWMPSEIPLAFTSMLTALAPAVEFVLGFVPALAGGLSVAVWIVWGIGSVLLIVLGFVATGLIARLRRRASVIGGFAKGSAGRP